jgi:hypothetical protein
VVTECADNLVFAGVAVTAVDKTGDSLVAGCTLFYDSGDLLRIGGAAATIDEFEAALNSGDLISGVYRDTAGAQSTIDISTDNDPDLTVTAPAAGGVTVDATTYLITGTGVATYTVAIYSDVDNGTTINAPDAKVGEGTVAADGTWAISVPISQNSANNFTANQRVLSTDGNGTPIDVPTITESAATAAIILTTTSSNGGVVASLDTGDTIIVNFNEDVTAPNAGDFVEVSETGGGGTAVRLTCGTNATCALDDADSISLLVTGPPTIVNVGDNGVVNTTGIITLLSGFVGVDTQAIGATSPAANRTFTPF